MTDFTPVDLLTTGTGETQNHLFITNILQKFLKSNIVSFIFALKSDRFSPS